MMENVAQYGFTELNEVECDETNGGFAITGAMVAKFAVTMLLRQGIKYLWNRAQGI